MEDKKTHSDSQNRTLYDSSYGEIFWKNFIAGFAKALGGLFVTLMLYVLLGLLFIKLVLPSLEPLITTMANLSKSIQSLPNANNAPKIKIPNINFQKILGQ